MRVDPDSFLGKLAAQEPLAAVYKLKWRSRTVKADGLSCSRCHQPIAVGERAYVLGNRTTGIILVVCQRRACEFGGKEMTK